MVSFLLLNPHACPASIQMSFSARTSCLFTISTSSTNQKLIQISTRKKLFLLPYILTVRRKQISDRSVLRFWKAWRRFGSNQIKLIKRSTHIYLIKAWNLKNLKKHISFFHIYFLNIKGKSFMSCDVIRFRSIIPVMQIIRGAWKPLAAKLAS